MEWLAYKIRVRKPKEPVDEDEAQSVATDFNGDDNDPIIIGAGNGAVGETEPMFVNNRGGGGHSLSRTSSGTVGGGSGTMSVMNHYRSGHNPTTSSTSNLNHPNHINREKKTNNHQLQPLLWMAKQHQHFNTTNHNFNKRFQPPTNDHQQQQKSEGEIILKKLNILIKKLKDMDEEDNITSEWRTVAMTLDRCLLIVFFFIYFLTIFVCFLRSPGYVS